MHLSKGLVESYRFWELSIGIAPINSSLTIEETVIWGNTCLLRHPTTIPRYTLAHSLTHSCTRSPLTLYPFTHTLPPYFLLPISCFHIRTSSNSRRVSTSISAAPPSTRTSGTRSPSPRVMMTLFRWGSQSQWDEDILHSAQTCSIVGKHR